MGNRVVSDLLFQYEMLDAGGNIDDVELLFGRVIEDETCTIRDRTHHPTGDANPNSFDKVACEQTENNSIDCCEMSFLGG